MNDLLGGKDQRSVKAKTSCELTFLGEGEVFVIRYLLVSFRSKPDMSKFKVSVTSNERMTDETKSLTIFLFHFILFSFTFHILMDGRTSKMLYFLPFGTNAKMVSIYKNPELKHQ